MQFAFTVAAYALDLTLDILVIAALLRNGYKRFPFLLIYVVVDFLTSVAELQPVMALIKLATPAVNQFWDTLYWWNERAVQVLVFFIVISLIYGATAQVRPRRTLLLGLVLAVSVFAAVTFTLHFDASIRTRVWMTLWTRDLNFGAAILNLGLWAVLISSREKDSRILMVAGGLGIQFTGGAIGQAFRGFLSIDAATVMGDLMYLTNLACLYIWWQAFRHPQRTRSEVHHQSMKERSVTQTSSD